MAKNLCSLPNPLFSTRFSMKKIVTLAFIYCGFMQPAFAQTPLIGDPADLPFSLDLEEVTQDELPGLHSFALAQWEGWWVVLCGRVGGLHGFFTFTAFPENEANTHIWLLNPETGENRQFAVDNLNIPFRDPLKSTNPQYAQDGSVLYIAGGYGKSATSGDFVTFPILTAIDLPKLVSAMLAGANPSAAFQQIEHTGMQVCGGEMDKMGERFYLVGGHDFAGKYSQMPSSSFIQKYTYEIRHFRIQRTANTLAIADFMTYHDEQNLRRRDFTLAPMRKPDGSPALVLYGGVFRPDKDLPYYNPVFIAENKVFELDNTYEQVFSQYTCPSVPMFDSTDGSMYTLFFGGLSVHTYNPVTKAVEYDERVPFVREIVTLRRQADGSSKEFVMPIRFDALLGSNMVFAPVETAPHYSNEVLKLRAMPGRTFVGYLFGGIKADIPNITTSSASKRMFKVYITPKSSSAVTEPKAVLQVSPNPFSINDHLRITLGDVEGKIMIFNTNGCVIAQFEETGSSTEEALSRCLQAATPGIYFLEISSPAGRQILKVVRM